MHISDLDAETRRKYFPDMGAIEARAPKRNPKDDAEKTFAFQCRAQKLPMFKREYKFAAESHGRGWRFDFAFLSYAIAEPSKTEPMLADWRNVPLFVAVEIEGLVVKRVNGELVTSGRHVHPSGFREDNVKYTTAAILGWSVLRFEQTQVQNGLAIDMTLQLLRAKGWKP
jgi:hypothetical protein